MEASMTQILQPRRATFHKVANSVLTIIAGCIAVCLSPALNAQEKPKLDIGSRTALEATDEDYTLLSPKAIIKDVTSLLSKRDQLPASTLAKAYRARADAFLAINDYPAALRDYDRLLKIRPADLDAKLGRARTLAYLEKTKEAITELKSIIQVDAKFAPVYVTLAGTYLREGNTQLALKTADEALALDPRCATAYHLRAMIHASKRSYDNALQDINRCLELDPLGYFGSHEEMYLLRGVVLLGIKRYKEAIRNFHLATQIRPDCYPAYGALFQVYRATKRYHLARLAAERMIKLKPQQSEPYQFYVVASAEAGDLKSALEATEQIIKLAPKSVTGYNSRGYVFFLMRDYRQAIQYYDKALSLDKKDTRTLANKALIIASSPHPDQRDGKKAKEIAEELCRNTSDKDAYLLMLLATAHAECGEFTDAVRRAQQALSLGSIPENDRTDYESRLKAFLKKQPFRLPRPEKDESEKTKEERKENSSEGQRRRIDSLNRSMGRLVACKFDAPRIGQIITFYPLR
jgi:tetratricopeptide (TPR) repeat protein